MKKELKNILLWNNICLSFSCTILTFTGIYIYLYVMKHLGVQDYSVIGIISGLLSYVMIITSVKPKVLQELMHHRWLAWTGYAAWVPLPLLLLYNTPFIYWVVNSAISCSLVTIGNMVQEEMNNAIFQGNDRTILTSVLRRSEVLGAVLGSLLALCVGDLDITLVCYFDICVTFLVTLTEIYKYKITDKEYKIVNNL